jgi:hypothetical protein
MLWKQYLIGLMSFKLNMALSPTWQAASKIFKERIDGNKPPVYEIDSIVPPDTPCILFFSGLNSFIPGEIYEEFLNNLAISGISAYSAPPEIDVAIDLLDDLLDDYANVTVVGHSSGSLQALTACNSARRVKNIVLMDPVDSSFLMNDFNEKDFTLKYVDNLLYLNAAKSYEWGLAPTQFKIPFIPAFKLTSDIIKLKKGNFKVIEATNFGHTDILDDVWSDSVNDIMKSGTESRDNGELIEYRFWLSSIIKAFILNENIQEETFGAEEQISDALVDVGKLYNEVSNKLSTKVSHAFNSMTQHRINNTSVLYRKY